MPNEYDFMKTKEERGMSEEAYKTARNEYNKQIKKGRNNVKLLIFIFIVLFVISLVLINIACHVKTIGRLPGSNYPGFGYVDFIGYNWVVIEFVLLLFLYEPKNKDEQLYKYEKDQNNVIKSLQNKINLNKIKFGFVICTGTIFIILNAVVWWLIKICSNSAEGL